MYHFLKLLMSLAVRVFFRRIVVEGREYLRQQGPLLVVANHPNTFMDAVLIAVHLPRPVYFLANASVFRNPVAAWLFRRLHMVPVYRQQDVRPGEKPDNSRTFDKCFAHLHRGKMLLIFPEGTSIHEKKLRPIKTGTARIALGAEAAQDFRAGVHLLCIGLNYRHPERFRSEVALQVAPPIAVADWQSLFQQDEREAVRQLTGRIEAALAGFVIQVENREQEQVLGYLDELYLPHLTEVVGLEKEHHKAAPFQLGKEMATAITWFADHEPERFEALKAQLTAYHQQLERLSLRDRWLGPSGKGLFQTMLEGTGILLGLPLFLYGVLHNYLPYLLPSKIAKGVSHEIEYRAPIMMVSGMFTFPLFYVLEIVIFGWFITPEWPWLALYGTSLPLSGVFAWWYAHAAGRWLGRLRWVRTFAQRSDLVGQLLHERERLIAALEEAREIYTQASS
jgi:1-acyl-sn-glycerol-3-phosphate acyltransferase